MAAEVIEQLLPAGHRDPGFASEGLQKLFGGVSVQEAKLDVLELSATEPALAGCNELPDVGPFGQGMRPRVPGPLFDVVEDDEEGRTLATQPPDGQGRPAFDVAGFDAEVISVRCAPLDGEIWGLCVEPEDSTWKPRRLRELVPQVQC
ncbi:MAG: hypothetical protein AAGM22_11870 [Acidobacteriota bacterium]